MRIPVAAAILLLSGCAGAPRVGEKSYLLVYGGKSGQVSRYSAEQTLRGRVSTQGMPQLVVIKTKSKVSRTVKEILDRGRRRVAVKFGIVSIEINGARIEAADDWRNIKAELVYAPSGTVEEEKSKDSGEMHAWIAKGLETFFPVFPEKAVRVGERWSRSARVGRSQEGMDSKMVITFSGFEDIDGLTCARLDIEGSVRGSNPGDLEGVGDLDLDYSGVTYFEPVAGRLIRARQKGSFRAKAKSQGMSVEARLNFIAQIKLATDP